MYPVHPLFYPHPAFPTMPPIKPPSTSGEDQTSTATTDDEKQATAPKAIPYPIPFPPAMYHPGMMPPNCKPPFVTTSNASFVAPPSSTAATADSNQEGPTPTTNKVRNFSLFANSGCMINYLLMLTV